MIITNKIVLKERTDESLENELVEKKFDKKVSESGRESYDYLLSIQVRHMTGEKLKELQNKEKDMSLNLEKYKKKDIKKIWEEELEEFLSKYKVWLNENAEIKSTKRK